MDVPMHLARRDDILECMQLLFKWAYEFDSNDHLEIYNRFDLITSKTPENSKWILSSERLPTESDGEVLVLMPNRSCEIAWATYWRGASNGFAGWTFRSTDFTDTAPTHWMKLPNIPID